MRLALPPLPAQVAQILRTFLAFNFALALRHLNLALAGGALAVLERILNGGGSEGVLAFSQVFILEATLAQFLRIDPRLPFFTQPEYRLVLQIFHLDVVREESVYLAAQGHDLAALLVGAHHRHRILDSADCIGIKARVAVGMGALGEPMEFGLLLFAEAQPAGLHMQFEGLQVVVYGGNVLGADGFILGVLMVVLLVGKLASPLARVEILLADNLEPSLQMGIRGVHQLYYQR